MMLRRARPNLMHPASPLAIELRHYSGDILHIRLDKRGTNVLLQEP